MKYQKRGRVAEASVLAVAAMLAGVPAVSTAQTQAQAQSQLRAQDKMRVIVAFKAGSGAGARAEIAAAGGRVVLDLNDVNAVAVELSRRAIAVLQRSRHVEFVEEDNLKRPLGTTPRSRGKTVAAAAEVVPYGIPMVQAPQVPDSLASNRKLCIIDSGYDIAHEDLSDNVVDGVNLTTSGSWFTDENQHGTHVAGTIAAIDNSVGVVGVLPNKKVSLYIAKVFDASGSASTSTVVRAMLSCASAGSNIISMSLGSNRPSRLEERVVDLLAGRNILLIAAAGNDGTNTVHYPAGFASVVSVAALDSTKTVAPFSQFNPDVELAGPGVDVLSTVPVGTGREGTLSVASAAYPVIAMDGSPVGTATALLANFGFGGAVDPAVSGKVCLISRGNEISFSDKVLNCQTSGGVGAVIYNNVPGPLNGTLGEVVTAIPSVGASDTDGAVLLGKLGQSATVSVKATSYGLLSGTSMATPHVSGVAALVWSYFPTCTAAQIRASLNKSAQDLGTAGRDNFYGFGLVQAKAAQDRITALGCGA